MLYISAPDLAKSAAERGVADRRAEAGELLSQLKNISGNTVLTGLFLALQFPIGETCMDDIQFKESFFYLDAYGNHALIVAFYQRHGYLERALQYLIDNVRMLATGRLVSCTTPKASIFSCK